MEKIIIFGTGDIGELAYYYFTHDTPYEVVAFTVDKEYLIEKEFCGLPVVEFQDVVNLFPPEKFKMFIAVSYAKVNQFRTEKYFLAKEKGYSLINYISTKATVFDNVKIGDNCFILEGSIIQPFSIIGNNVTVWSGSHIGHHSVIKDNCFIAPNVAISGGVTIEPFCFIGINSTIKNHITISRSTVTGAGSLIVKNTDQFNVYKSESSKLSNVPSNLLKKI